MKKVQLFLVMLFVSCLTVAAQNLTVTGKVTYADDGSPVIGATISVKGTNVAVLSDVNGAYKITIPTSTQLKVLEFSFTGLQTKEVSVSQSGNIDVSLAADTRALEEVVVTGYGSFSKRDYTGSAATVSTSRTKDVPSVSVQSRIAGAIPGVQITSTSGQPGAVESVRIRGMGSINAGNEPLYVVDGVPVFTGNANNFGYAVAGNSILSTINPNDIENITVIKDAAAASLYGSRAANGVIIITTKKGKSGKTTFNSKASYGVTSMAENWRPVLGGEETRTLWHLALKNYGQYTAGMSETAAIKLADDEIDGFYTKPWSGWTNWRDYLLKTGKAQQYEVSASGGNEKTRFFSSLSYSDMEGITLRSDYKRITGRANVSHTAGRFTLEAGTMFSNTNQDVDSEGTSYSSPMMAIAIALSPADYPYNPDGSINITEGFPFPGNPLANPLQSAEYNYNTSTVNRTMTNVSGKLDIADGLAIKQVLSYDLIASNNRVWWDPRSNDGKTAGGVYQKYWYNRSTLTSQSQIMYNKTFASKHNVAVLGSFEVENYNLDYVSANGQNYPTYLLPEVSNAGTKSGGSGQSGYSMMSYLVDANYNYDNKYYGKISFRRDGSSRLAKENRWGNFWAASASWKISEEDFFRSGSVSNVVNDLKIRASYGVNGTQPAGYYDFMGLFGYGYNYNGAPGSAEAQMPNPQLTWESNVASNIGLDFTLFNKVFVTFDIYQRDTKDLILGKPISTVTGFGSIATNIGSLRNKGMELDVKFLALSNADFYWNIGLNLANNTNTVIALADGQKEIQEGRWTHRLNNPYYAFNLFEFAGVDPATGREQYYTNTPKKVNEDFEIIDRTITTDATKVNKAIVGRWDPVIQGGITNNFNWKNLDLGFTLTYSLGGQCVDNMAVNYTNGASWAQDGVSIPTYNDINKMWKKPGDIAELPMYAYGGSVNNYTSTRFLMSTDHLRMKNITLGYSLPKSILSKIKFEKIRFYASANNLFTIKDKNMYLDPETPIGGSVSFETPQLRTVTFGIELGF
ncbi:SusC [Mucinivorans hirudinis]|uniref:SusC n=1 Tax=Mucinivorans hirudinis TaxID=1433126 RepID=A0A060RDP7_9BACT|nr:SusC [Mucinivorans hirudinis]